MSLFALHRADADGLDDIAAEMTAFGARAESVGSRADRIGWLAGSVESEGLFGSIRSALRPAVDGGVLLAASSQVGSLAVKVWSRAVRDYNRTIEDLNEEWESAKAGSFGVGSLELERGSMSPAEVGAAAQDHADAVADAKHVLWAALLRRQGSAEDRLDAIAEGVAYLLGNSTDPEILLLAASMFADPDAGTGEPDDYQAYNPYGSFGTVMEGAGEPSDPSWSDLGDILAFVFADPRECVGDDASAGGCGLEIAGLIPIAKAPKWGIKLAKYLRKSRKAEDAAKHMDDVPSPRSPMGHRGKEIDIPDGTNGPAVIGDRQYSGHALDRMQKRGFTPSVVEDAVRTNPRVSTGDGKYIHYDPENKISVIVNEDGRIITVIPRDVRP